MERFNGRVAFITGAGHGIGKATAHRLASEGASISAADIDNEACERVVSELSQMGYAAHAVHLDVTNSASVRSAIKASTDYFGQLDILVNTAGGDVVEPPFTEMPDDLWQRALDLNLTSVMRCIRTALPSLLASSNNANVVTIGSVNGLTAMGSYPYSAAKAGLELLTRNLAAEYGRRNVRFNLVAPGTIRTRVWDDQPESLARLSELYPLGRVGEPDDIAAAVAFLASDDASWITGVTLPVDGGLLAGPRGMIR